MDFLLARKLLCRPDIFLNTELLQMLKSLGGAVKSQVKQYGAEKGYRSE